MTPDPQQLREQAEQAAAAEPQMVDQLALLMQLHQDVLRVQRMAALCVGLCAALTMVAIISGARNSSNVGLES